jgi:hypothetical protein
VPAGSGTIGLKVRSGAMKDSAATGRIGLKRCNEISADGVATDRVALCHRSVLLSHEP